MPRIIFFILLCVLLLPVSGQTAGSDTIPYNPSLLKSAADFSNDVVFETTADTVITLVINELMAINAGVYTDSAGDDDDWFEIHNYGDIPILMNNLCFSDNPSNPFKWQMNHDDPVFLEPGGFMVFWADDEPWQGYEHVNFSLSGDGEFLGMYDSEGQLVDHVMTSAQSADVSYGRSAGAGLDWYYFSEPTPGAENVSTEYLGLLPRPTTNREGGVLSAPVQLVLGTPEHGAEVRYTTDCNDPDENSPLFDDPLEIDSTVIVKARLFKAGFLDGTVLTLTFLMDEAPYENPVLSVVANRGDLYGNEGLITTSSKTKEVAGHIEYFGGGEPGFAAGAGIQLHGRMTPKPVSMRLYARSRYGDDWFNCDFFEGEGEAPERFKRLVLRNSGNDNINKGSTNTHMRDPLIQQIAKNTNRNPMVSASRPVNVFLNGKYLGIFNLRERIDEYYIKTHAEETGDFDLLERAFGYPGNQYAIEGSFDRWKALLSFADTVGDLSKQEDFKVVEGLVDLENFTDYWITEVFVGNYDWLSNNIKYWKPEHGKWQWIYWDTDHGLGLKYQDYGDVGWNTLEWSLTFSDRAWSSGYNNILIRNLLKNDNYKAQFIKRFNTLLNSCFTYRETAPLLQSMKARYQNDIALHAEKYNRSVASWNSACMRIDNYMQQRPVHVMSHLQDFFGLDDPVPVTFQVFPSGGGTIFWEDEWITGDTLTGQFFPGLSYGLKALPAPGFLLESLVVNGQPVQHDSVAITGPATVEAFFMPRGMAMSLQLTEVYYNNREAYDSGDWIEFYHYGNSPLNLSGSKILSATGDTLFTFGDNAVVSPNTWFMVAESEKDFLAVYPPIAETLKGAAAAAMNIPGSNAGTVAASSAANIPGSNTGTVAASSATNAPGSNTATVAASSAAVAPNSTASTNPMVFGGLTGGIPADIAFRLVSAEGEDYMVAGPMTSPGWPVISDEGYSLQLKELAAGIYDPHNWKVSQTVYGSPGLPNEQTRYFHPPEGRDTVISNHAHVTLELPSMEFYNDPDGHALSHIAVILTDGPGVLLLGDEQVEGNVLREPADLSFVPAGPAGEVTIMLYKFIDRSGQASMLHELRFEDVTGTRGVVADGLSRYPNPARESCIFVFDRPVNEPCTVSLLDLTGKTVLHTSYPAPGTRLEINVSDIPSGLYFYRLKAGDRTYAGKVQVQR